MDIVKASIEQIRFAHDIASTHGNTLVCAYSGGKDSDVMLDLCLRTGVPFRVQHNHTTVDAPETVYHIREVFSRLNAAGIPTVINHPEMSMWRLIEKKLMPPTRIARYCCEYLKERKLKGHHLLLGVRQAESNSRRTRGVHEALGLPKGKREAAIIHIGDNDARRRMTEICILHNRVATNPIIDWTDREIWQYIRERKLKTNMLYECGFTRVGCIGCPMATSNARFAEFRRYPKYKANYISAFERMLKARKYAGKDDVSHGTWITADSVFRWWTELGYNPDQIEWEV